METAKSDKQRVLHPSGFDSSTADSRHVSKTIR